MSLWLLVSCLRWATLFILGFLVFCMTQERVAKRRIKAKTPLSTQPMLSIVQWKQLKRRTLEGASTLCLALACFKTLLLLQLKLIPHAYLLSLVMVVLTAFGLLLMRYFLHFKILAKNIHSSVRLWF